MKKYYLIRVIYENRDCFLIWYSDIEDAFLVYEQKLLMFKNLNDVKRFAEKQVFLLEEEITVYDFSNIIDLINHIELSQNCHKLFDAWNFFSDLAKALNKVFIGDSEEEFIMDIYDKLFYGSNLKVLKRDEEYHPTFDYEEKQKCVSVFLNGLSMLDKEFNIAIEWLLSTQEQKIASIETFQQNSKKFIEETARIDSEVADVINQRKDDFYEQYNLFEAGIWKNRMG